MDIHIAAFRNRIGTFNSSSQSHLSYLPENLRKQCKKSSSKTVYNFRRLTVCMILIISILSRIETQPRKLQDSSQTDNFVGPQAKSSTPISFIVLGGQVAASFFPANHLSYHDILAVHSAATLQGVQAGHLDRGWIVVALPLQHSILSDSNFYARYTYGNRTNRGIKLSHWNAGSAYLENKTIEIENVISDHHPHLLGISEANLHRNHCIDNCKIDDYDLITCKTLDNVNLQISRVVVYKHNSLVAKVREDLMSDSFSSIWLEVGFPGRTRFLNPQSQ